MSERAVLVVYIPWNVVEWRKCSYPAKWKRHTYGMMTKALQSEVVSCRLVGDREARMKDLGYPLTNSVELIVYTYMSVFLALLFAMWILACHKQHASIHKHLKA